MQNYEDKPPLVIETKKTGDEAVLQKMHSIVITSPEGNKNSCCFAVDSLSTTDFDLITENSIIGAKDKCIVNEKIEDAMTQSGDDIKRMETVSENKCQSDETISSVNNNLESEKYNQSKMNEILGMKNDACEFETNQNSPAQISNMCKKSDKLTDSPFSKAKAGEQNESGSDVDPVKAESDIKTENITSDDNGTSHEIFKKSKKLEKSNENICQSTETVISDSDKNENLVINNLQNQNEIPPQKNNAAANDFFEIGIPLIGKATVTKEVKPFAKRYDLAFEMNRRRFQTMQRRSWKNGTKGLAAWEIEANAIFKDKNKSPRRKKIENINMALNLTKINLKLLQELSRNSVRQRVVKFYLLQLSKARVTPTALLYAPHVVHTVSLCRGSRSFCKDLRLVADDCYGMFHAMFPVPMGYNFETVYTSQVGKHLQDPLEKMQDIQLNYGDVSDLFSDCEND